MDGDLQDPPELIPTLVDRWRAGYDIVATAKVSRPESLPRRLAFRAFYALFRLMSDVPLLPESGLFSLMDRRVVDVLLSMPERIRFLPALRAWAGFRSTVVTYSREPRCAGAPQGTRKLVRMAVDALLAFSTVPLRLAIVMGLVFAGTSFVAIVAISYLRIIRRPELIPGWTSEMVAVVFIGAIQLLFLGIVAEYLGRVYQEVKGRPLYVVSDRLNPAAAPPVGAATRHLPGC
jgi:hypothetical protein